jgi:hypothetical protein
MTLTFPNVYFSVPGKWHNNYLKQSKINVVQVYILKQCSKISFGCMAKNDNKSLSDQKIGITFIRYARYQKIGITFIRYARYQKIQSFYNKRT